MASVSVVVPSYNCASLLPKAIESVLNQTFKDLEVIVVNDGSKDDTDEVVKPYLPYIRYVHQANKGLPGARNTAIRLAKGDFLALLDADDSWLPQKLERQMPLFNNPEVGIVYSDFAVHYADGRFLDSYLKDRPLASEGYVIENYLRSRFLFPSTMVLRTKAVQACGLFDEEMVAAEDIELFAKICLRWKVARVPEVLMLRTEGTQNITANGSKMSDYTILAFEKILTQENSLAAPVRKILHRELALQHWWRGYALYKSGEQQKARTDLLSSMRYDWRKVRSCAPVLLASLMPQRRSV